MVDRVCVDKASGDDVHRPPLDQLLDFIREGDTLVIHSMDRLTTAWHLSMPKSQPFPFRRVRLAGKGKWIALTGEAIAK